MEDVQVYITVDGYENGKKWMPEPKADLMGDFLQFILESLTLDQAEELRLFMHCNYGEGFPKHLRRSFKS